MSNALAQAFRKWAERHDAFVAADELYDQAVSLVDGIRFDLQDIVSLVTNESRGQPEIRDYGLFVSAAMNAVMQEDSELALRVGPWVRYIGAFLDRGTVVVEPVDPKSSDPLPIYHACSRFGYRMRGGRLIVRSNTGVDVGYGMVGGEIVSEGDYEARDDGEDMGLGRKMSGGKMRVEGGIRYHRPAPYSPFSDMSDGTVEILGDVRSNECVIGHGMTGGEVFVSGDCDHLGWGMLGGAIRIGGNASTVAPGMTGGAICVEGGAGYVAREMSGGEVKVEQDCEAVGSKLSGRACVEVKGSVRGEVGDRMRDGAIMVWGDVGGPIAQEMRGGEIHIKGSCSRDQRVGNRMTGGTVRIDGDVNAEVGDRMKGGEIHIGGSMPRRFCVRYGGRVYQGDRLVRDSLGARIVKWFERKVFP